VLPEKELSVPRSTNITGLTDTPNDLADATVALARKLKPQLRRIGVLYTPTEENSVSSTDSVRKSTTKEGIELVTASTDAGPEAATSALLAKAVDIILIPKDRAAGGNVATIVETALRVARDRRAKQPTPVIAMDSGSVQDPKNGAVAAASAEYYTIGRDTGRVVREILSGRKPNTIPITGPSQSRTYVNLTSASAFCLTGLKTIFPDAEFSGAENPSACVAAR
jgi:putative ABC transport system substrate-binding protein